MKRNSPSDGEPEASPLALSTAPHTAVTSEQSSTVSPPIHSLTCYPLHYLHYLNGDEPLLSWYIFGFQQQLSRSNTTSAGKTIGRAVQAIAALLIAKPKFLHAWSGSQEPLRPLTARAALAAGDEP
jgi:hypothetical protein